MPMFDEPGRYRCCCGCCRATTGAVIIGILDVITAAVLLWQGLTGKFVLFPDAHNEYDKPIRQAALVSAGVFGAIGLLAVFAVICRLPCLLIFHMVVDIAALLAFGLLAALVSVIAFVSAAEGQIQADTTLVIICLSVIGVYAFLQIWYFLIMLAAYRSLSEEYPARNGDMAQNGATYTMVPSNGSTATANNQAYYYSADGLGGGAGTAGGTRQSIPPSYTPMLSTPNYYKQQSPYTASSPPMYG